MKHTLCVISQSPERAQTRTPTRRQNTPRAPEPQPEPGASAARRTTHAKATKATLSLYISRTQVARRCSHFTPHPQHTAHKIQNAPELGGDPDPGSGILDGERASTQSESKRGILHIAQSHAHAKRHRCVGAFYEATTTRLQQTETPQKFP